MTKRWQNLWRISRKSNFKKGPRCCDLRIVRTRRNILTVIWSWLKFGKSMTRIESALWVNTMQKSLLKRSKWKKRSITKTATWRWLKTEGGRYSKSSSWSRERSMPSWWKSNSGTAFGLFISWVSRSTKWCSRGSKITRLWYIGCSSCKGQLNWYRDDSKDTLNGRALMRTIGSLIRSSMLN